MSFSNGNRCGNMLASRAWWSFRGSSPALRWVLFLHSSSSFYILHSAFAALPGREESSETAALAPLHRALALARLGAKHAHFLQLLQDRVERVGPLVAVLLQHLQHECGEAVTDFGVVHLR